jgi:hypothetical protein
MPQKHKLRIYVAGPYTAPTSSKLEENTKRAIDAGIALLHKGHTPFIPHLTHYVDLRAQERGITISWDEYIKWDTEWLDACDALLYLGSSKGADLELEHAKAAGKQVFMSVEDVPTAGENPDQSATRIMSSLGRR